jgi:hypothetical protein
VEYFGIVLLAIVVLVVALARRERRRRASADVPLSIRDHDRDRRVYGSSQDVPQSDANRFGPGDVGGGSL